MLYGCSEQKLTLPGSSDHSYGIWLFVAHKLWENQTKNIKNKPPLLQLVLRHTTDAVGCKVCVTSLEMQSSLSLLSRLVGHLNAAQATEIFIALLLPFCNQVGICNLFLKIVSSDSSAKFDKIKGDALTLMQQSYSSLEIAFRRQYRSNKYLGNFCRGEYKAQQLMISANLQFQLN